MKTIRKAAEELGMTYITLLRYVKKHLPVLLKKGVIVERKGIKRSRYFTPDPELLVETIKKLEFGGGEKWK
jgi:molybdenum-dependent DNA-binding transcriptional regulator ModE